MRNRYRSRILKSDDDGRKAVKPSGRLGRHSSDHSSSSGYSEIGDRGKRGTRKLRSELNRERRDRSSSSSACSRERRKRDNDNKRRVIDKLNKPIVKTEPLGDKVVNHSESDRSYDGRGRSDGKRREKDGRDYGKSGDPERKSLSRREL